MSRAFRPRSASGWGCRSTTANCWSRKPFVWECRRPNWRRSTNVGPGFSSGSVPGSIYQRYFEALGQLMHELADAGNVILVGRGGSRILRDDPRAFHVRLVAPMPVRVRRVMEYRWVQEGIAKKLIAESDSRRSNFYESYFGADWSSPLEYDLTVNSGRLGPTAVDAVATGRRASLEPC